MKNYFLTSIDKRQLQDAQVEFCDLEIDGQAGVVVDQENIGPALRIISAHIKDEEESSLQGIFRVTLAPGILQSDPEPGPAPQIGTVSIAEDSRFKCEHWKSFARSTQKWVEEAKLPLDVVLYFLVEAKKGSSDSLKRPQGDGKLHLFFGKEDWEVPGAQEDAEGHQKAQHLAGLGYIRIYNLPDCPSIRDEESTKTLLLRLLPLAVENDRVKVEEIVQKQVEEHQRKSREQYVKECSKRFEKTLKGTREKISSGKTEVERLQKALTKKIREVIGAERKLRQMETSRSGQEQSYGREFDSLSDVPGVEDVQVADGVIKVFTEHIYITPDDCPDTFDIGCFRMEINTSGSNGGVRFFNITRQGKGGGHSGYNHNHPHVDKSGAPCLGNISELVSQLIGEYEYSAVAQLGLQYLKSVNTGDPAGSGIYNAWPKKGEEK